MRVVTKTGLVPVHTKHDKAVFGVSPETAAKGVAKGDLFLVEIPEGIETHEFEIPGAVIKAEPEGHEDKEDIPADWESLHWAKLVSIAKKIINDELPEVADKKPADVAREIIREELARRDTSSTENQAN